MTNLYRIENSINRIASRLDDLMRVIRGEKYEIIAKERLKRACAEMKAHNDLMNEKEKND